MKKYFINKKEVTLDQFKKEYAVVLKFWLSEIEDEDNSSYNYEMDIMFSKTSPYNSMVSTMLGYEFKIIKEENNDLLTV